MTETLKMIMDIIREYQYDLECIMDCSNSVSNRFYIRSSIKYDAAEELKGLILRRCIEKGADLFDQ